MRVYIQIHICTQWQLMRKEAVNLKQTKHRVYVEVWREEVEGRNGIKIESQK